MSTPAEPPHEILFYQALELPQSQRGHFLDGACPADGELRREVDELLRAHGEATQFLPEEGLAAPKLEREIGRIMPEQTGDRLGPYKLLEQIGEGGFGTVWVAEQEKPIRRRVALKIIKLGMDTKEVIARFEQERQALAMMDHPNIAKVLDAGAGPSGRPFFVMELVRGIKITTYCDQAHLPTSERLRIFIAVCHAVQHAHQKGIIHRDLKPSNILVTLHDGVPVPKVIDFGVAKATQQQRLTDLTIYTQFEQMVGTPLYMSPEQAEMSGLDIDTRSDIYSLGVLLYELLVGRTPFDPETLMKRGLDEIRRVVREQEPQKPSTFVSTMALDWRTNVAQHRQTEGSKLIGQIRGDLDWIVMKALEKDRARRYETANNFAEDIQRHLSSEPVQARPTTQLYRFRRFAKSNKTAFAAAGAVLATLVTGLSVSTWMFFKEKDARNRAVAAEESQRLERQKAENEAGKSRQIAKLLQDMLKGVGPSAALGRDSAMLREILEKTSVQAGKDLQDQPEVEAELRTIIGDVYSKLGEYVKANAMLGEALAITKNLRGNEHRDVVTLLNAKAQVLGHQGSLDEAEAMLREALTMERKLAGKNGDVTTSLNNLAVILADRGKFAEAETVHRESLALTRKILGTDHADVATSLSNLAVVLMQESKPDEAETALREAVAIQKKRLGNDHPDVATTLNNLANVVQMQNKLKESEALFLEVVELQRKLLGNAHPNVAAGLNGLGLALLKQGRAAEAEPFLREGVAIERKARKSAHPQTARLIGNLGRIMEGQQKFAEAEALYREALTMYGTLPGDEHPDMTSWRNQLHNLLQAQGKPTEPDEIETKPEAGPDAVQFKP